MWKVRAAGWRLGDTLLGANVSSVTPSGGFGFRWGSEHGQDSEQQPRLSIDLRAQRRRGSSFPNQQAPKLQHGPSLSCCRENCSLTALLSLMVHCYWVTLSQSVPVHMKWVHWIPWITPEWLFVWRNTGLVRLNLSLWQFHKLFPWAFKRMDTLNWSKVLRNLWVSSGLARSWVTWPEVHCAELWLLHQQSNTKDNLIRVL